MFRYLMTLSALVATLIIPTSAHTWIEEYQVIGPNGSYIGDRGFSRGYIARTDPDFDGSFNSEYLLPPADAVMPDGTIRLRINSTDPVCRPSQQTSNYTNPDYPMLKAAPGDYVAMKYLENGHVTLPWTLQGKPAYGGTVYVFGTTTPITNEMLVDVMKWNTEGTGGNGRGRLLAKQNFDDGRCHQLNDCTNSVERQGPWPNSTPGLPGSVNELWCETDVKLPDDLQSGKYTTYWVWQWPTAPGKDCGLPEGKDEWYTTCADHEIIAPGADDFIKLADAPATNTLVMEGVTTIAVATYKERTAHTTYPIALDNWANYKVNAVSTMDAKVSSFNSVCQASMATAAAATGLPPLCPSGKWATGTLAAFYKSKGIASAKSAAAALGAQVTRSAAASTSAPVAAPTHQPAAGSSPSVTITGATSASTGSFTRTETVAATHLAGRPKPSPHRGSHHQGQHHQGQHRQGPHHQGPHHQGPHQQGPHHQGPPPQGPPHRGTTHHNPPHHGAPGGGYPTVRTEATGAQTGTPIRASALVPGHQVSTAAVRRHARQFEV